VLRGEGGESRVLLDAASGRAEAPRGRWIFPNARAVGFYRYALDATLRERLLARARDLDPEERLNLIDNDWALLRAGVLDASAYVDLLRALEGEGDRAVLGLLHDQLRWLSSNVLAEDQRGAFEELVTRIYAPSLERLGLTPRAGDGPEDEQLRPVVIRTLAAVARSAEVRREATALIGAHLEGRALDRNVIQANAIAAAVDGDAALVERYLEHMKRAGDVQEEKRFQLPLAFFEDAGAADAAIRATFDGTIREQDLMFVLEEAVQNGAARDRYLRAMEERWDERIAPLEQSLRQYIIRAVSRVGIPLAPAMTRLLRAKQVADTAESTAQALERLRLGDRTAERIREQLVSAFASEVAAGRSGH
jgi:puromycin-sensitive aminopeptidase